MSNMLRPPTHVLDNIHIHTHTRTHAPHARNVRTCVRTRAACERLPAAVGQLSFAGDIYHTSLTSDSKSACLSVAADARFVLRLHNANTACRYGDGAMHHQVWTLERARGDTKHKKYDNKTIAHLSTTVSQIPANVGQARFCWFNSYT